MAGNPVRFLASSLPWRCWAYAATGAVIGAFLLPAVLLLCTLGVALSLVGVGLVLLGALAVSGIPVGALERHRLRLLGAATEPSPHPELPVPVSRQWLAIRLRERATWRALSYALLAATVFWLLDYLVAALPGLAMVLLLAPLWYALFAGPGGMTVLNVHIGSLGDALLTSASAIPVLVLSGYAVAAVAAARVAMVRALLTEPRDAEVRVMELVRSSGRVLTAFDAETRRIERDLHDGTQQRLIALSMSLDMAMMTLDGPARELVSSAQLEAGRALTELREIIHGIHPHVLTERGLPVAVAELATSHPVPIDVELELPGRLPPAVESAAFFAISEALANVAKHAGAEHAWVHGRLTGGRLALEIGDTGHGGAAPSHGTGLRGLADRIGVLGGQVLMSSPAGGPTVLRLRIPVPPASES